MDELVEVEDVVADKNRKTTKFGGSERGREKDPNTLCQVKHAARSFFGNDIAKLLAVVLRSEFRL